MNLTYTRACRLFAGASALAMGLIAPAAVWAAPPASSGAGAQQLEELVVTARKREEAAQSVPIAVTVMNKQALVAAQVATVADLQKQTPSLSVHVDPYSPFGAQVAIRGQRQQDTLLSEQPAVGIYIDGVYNANTQALGVASFWDIDRVETLKGPQGTLFGRNTTGGAISITTTPPDYSGYHGDILVGAGDYSSTDDALALNVPLVADKLAVRADLQYHRNGAYAQDIGTDRPLLNIDAVSGRFAVRMDPADDLRVMLRADYSDGRSGGQNRKLAYVDPTGVAAIDAAVHYGLFTAIPVPPFLAPNAPAGAAMLMSQVPTNPYVENYDQPENAISRTHGMSATVEYDLTSDLTLKSISGYREGDLHAAQDSDGSPINILNSPREVRAMKQWTQEFDLNGTALSNRIHYTGGVYYYYLSGKDVDHFFALADLTGGAPEDTYAKIQEYSYAIFGQATYAITDKLNFTGGLRWTDELQRQQHYYGCASSDPNYCSFKVSASNISYTADVDYHLDPEKMVYFRTARGFKGGGVNERSEGGETFLPEVVTDYEVGLKSDYFDHRLRLNVDYFHSKYDEIQRTVVAPLAGGGITSIIVNAASAAMDGAELAVDMIPVQGLTLGVSGDYLYPKYLKYVNGLGQDLSDHKFDSPRWQYNLSGQYAVPTQLGDLTGGLNYVWQSSVDFQPDNHLNPGNAVYTTQKGYGLLDGRLSLRLKPQELELAFWMKNITNKTYITGALDTTGAGLGFINQFYGIPRTWGFEVRKHF